jgi:hypothetical protein
MDERRANPPGWVPPRAPYNPYDPTDIRPPEGYPSEFKIPGKPRSWSVIPKEPTNYRVVKESLKQMQYTPRPLSDLYPGQYKVLKRLGDNGFKRGVRLSSIFMTSSVLIVGIFFYRWNDGYDNIFSKPYRMQLSLRDKLFGNLSDQQKEDLDNKARGIVKIHSQSAPTPVAYESKYEDLALERPMRNHLLEVERQRQEREEAILRAVDIAEAELSNKTSTSNSAKRWFGIF